MDNKSTLKRVGLGAVSLALVALLYGLLLAL